jgi:integrase
MPSGACVIKYKGRRGVVWYVKYRDASGRQVKEKVGSAAEGCTKRKAEALLRARLTDVSRDQYVKPERATFTTLAEEWLADYPVAKELKRSTRRAYEVIVRTHLIDAFGTLLVGEIDVERIERYLAAKAEAGYSSGSRNRQLNVLSLIMRAAVRRHLIATNPVALVDRPREKRRRWRILTPEEVAAVERAFDELIAEEAEADNARDHDDLTVVRRLFLLHLATGVRRGEAAGLRWRSVFLADPEGAFLRVEETWVRHALDTPKSEAGRRTIDLGRRIADELFEHRAWSAFDGEDELVFPNPRTGHPFDANRYSELIGKAYKRAGIEGDVRPSHDLRHSSITNAARAGTMPEALMARAGHSSYSTTRRYIDLAGARFRDEADALEQRLFGGSGTKNRYQTDESLAGAATPDDAKPLQ